MNRRDFLKALAAVPAIAAVPALAAPKIAEMQVGRYEGVRIIKSPRKDWLATVAKTRQLGYAHGFEVAPSRAERQRLFRKWRAEAKQTAEKWGMVVTERDEHYIAPLPDNRDPYDSRGYLAAKYTLGRFL